MVAGGLAVLGSGQRNVWYLYKRSEVPVQLDGELDPRRQWLHCSVVCGVLQVLERDWTLGNLNIQRADIVLAGKSFSILASLL